MGKPLSGKRAFEAMGRRASATGLPLLLKRMERLGWPRWAREAYARGWIQQQTSRQRTERIVQTFVDKSVRDGISLKVTVDRFLADMREGDQQ
ncbi:hypothetical protein C7405_101694 [Paraburkholderia caballeronis]|uniref:hypothetical protein n=1 Tax=Paraburkholderia caballeronis TaxID=416943 RepID=UPI0010666811|nr:hypothetical protein [Paraburkholderia caballeronis]TDV39575.1 hypothetical protein C7405_101694 [Paraburkholderia caballeronis]